jgi:hypothetical protein
MKNNHRIPRWLVLLALAMLNPQFSTIFAQSTAFNYQGYLNDGGNPASGIYDVRFTVYDSTNSPGNILAGPITNSGTTMSNGLFSVTLDFGADVFTGPGRWLQLDVRTNCSVMFTTLAPRQQILPTPYAVMAGSASNLLGTLPAAQLSGTVPVPQMPAAVVTNGETGVTLTGTFNGSAGGSGIACLTNTNFNTFIGVGAGCLVTNGQIPPVGSYNTALGWQAEINLVSGMATMTLRTDNRRLVSWLADRETRVLDMQQDIT